MQLNYSKINAKTREATVYIYGEIGKEINGNYLASDIAWLDKYADVDVIVARINSSGGSVIQGLSMVSAVVAAKTPTLGIIEGIAASMAGVFALACKKTKINDFGRLMLHSAVIADADGNAVPDDKLSDDEKEDLKNMNTQLKELLSRRDKTTAEIDEIMSKDTWFTAKEAKEAGLVDEIIDTGVTYGANYAPNMVMAFAAGLSQQMQTFTNNKDNMKQIAAKLGLAETADVTAILAELDRREKDSGAATAKLASDTKSLVDAALKLGKLTGKVNDSNEEKLRKLAAADMELFLDFVVGEPADNGMRLSDVIDEIKKMNPASGGDTVKDWDWYQKNDPDALKELKRTDRAAYDKLYKAYWGDK